MGEYYKIAESERIFLGVDLHKKIWYVTIRTADVELFKGGIVGNWGSLR